MVSYCALLKSELNPCQAYYSPGDVTGNTFDIQTCFCPSSTAAVVAKIALGVFTMYTFSSMLVSTLMHDIILVIP